MGFYDYTWRKKHIEWKKRSERRKHCCTLYK